MRKLLLLTFAMLSCWTYAQEWQMVIEPGDAMKGTQERVRYRYEVAGAEMFTFYADGDLWKVGVVMPGFKIDPRSLNRNQNFRTYANIGFYDIAGNLTGSYNDCELEVTDGYRVASLPEYIRKKKENGQTLIADYLRNEQGYVRIIIEKTHGKEFDMRVPCLNNGNVLK